MSLTTKVLIALVVGLAIGVAISTTDNTVLRRVPGLLEPVGTIWVNGLRMTVIPLVVSAILIGIASMPDTRSIGRIGGRAMLCFLVVLLVTAAFTVVVGPVVLSGLHIDGDAARSLRATAQVASGDAMQSAKKITGFGQWLVDLVPTNPIKAAADGAMLPLISFTLLLGLAITRISAEGREHLMGVVRGVNDASLLLVRWVLVAAPVGVFALSVPLATRLGISAAGAVAYFVVAVSSMLVAYMLLLYLAAWIIGKQGLRTFARAAAPAQAVAFSSRSSLVALPAMLEGADTVMHLPLAIRSFLLPLAVAMFRCGAAIALPFGVLFAARLYGVELSAAQLVTVALTSVLTTFSAPGIPGGSIIVMVPVLLAVDLPVGAVGLLLGVDTIPDMFRTTTNVTGDMAVAAILARFEPAGAPS